MKPQASLMYPIKVWALTSVLSPFMIVVYVWMQSADKLSAYAFALQLYMGCVCIGLVVTVPMMFIVLIIYHVILRHFQDLRTIKVIIVLCAIVLMETTLIAIGLIEGIAFAELSCYALAYIAAMSVSAFVLDIGRREEGIEDLLV